MDERLEAGRHHLSNGTRALEQGFLDEGRSHFEAALLQFRGPELRLGEAHALRGVAKVELSVGNTAEAAARIGRARQAYRETAEILEVHETSENVEVMLLDARRGEASCLIIAAEIASRQGDLRSAKLALELAGKLVAERELPSGPLAMQQGHLHLRNGALSQAHTLFTQALDSFAEVRDEEGQVDALCAQAEVHRIKREVSPAEQVLGRALALARGSRIGLLEGKVLAKLADVRLQARDLGEAERLYAEAVPLLHEAGSTGAEAFALVGWGVARSLLDEPDALRSLIEGTRLLALLDDRDGFAAAAYRLAEHAIRNRQTSLGLVSAEASRRAWSAIDPVEGVGRAMRMVVKALSAAQQTRSAYLVAKARASVAGAVQPNAARVVEHFAPHLDADWKARVDALSDEQLIDVALARISELADEAVGDAELPVPGSVGELVAWADRAGELAVSAGEERQSLAEQLAADTAAEEFARQQSEESEPITVSEDVEAEALAAEEESSSPTEAPVTEETAASDEPELASMEVEDPTTEEPPLAQAAEKQAQPPATAPAAPSDSTPEEPDASEEPPVAAQEGPPLDASASEVITAALEDEEADETLRVRRRGDSTPVSVEESDWNDLLNDLNTDEVPRDQVPPTDLSSGENEVEAEVEEPSVGLLVDEPVLDEEPPARRTPVALMPRDESPGSTD